MTWWDALYYWYGSYHLHCDGVATVGRCDSWIGSPGSVGPPWAVPHPHGVVDLPATVGALVNPLVALIVSQPGMAERLLAVHADDGTGRCRVCSGGAQTGRYVWPCTIHGYAILAVNEVERRGEEPRRRST